MKYTVVIPALNEELDLPRTLESVKFADEIILIDTGSTDRTVSIAKKYGAKVVNHSFTTYSDLRSFGDAQASNDWVLSIEADVVVPESLKKELASLSSDPAVYRLGRVNYIWGAPILHSDWSPRDDNHVRFYHKSLGSWQGDVHELFTSTVKPKQLSNHLIHYNYRTISEFITKLNSYSQIEAQRRFHKKQPFSIFNLFYEPKKEFFKRYIYKLGFLDGYHGLFLSLLQAMYYFSVNIKLKYLTSTNA